MAKQCYIPKNFNKSSLVLIDMANEVIEEYQALGYQMTLRQLYYQLVAADLIPNNIKTYKRLASILNDARWAGLVDWDAIEDRARVTRSVSTWSSPVSILQSAIHSYREDLWRNQDYHIEVMCEKDAVSNILQPVCAQYGVNFTANRGYPSASLLYETAGRLRRKIQIEGKNVEIIYIGDHDPSGMDMDRDILERLSTLLDQDIEVGRLALTRFQVNDWRLPPNPAKITDSRSDGYIAEYGRQSWELDAIKANILHDLIEEKILEYIDLAQWNEDKDDQDANLQKLRDFRDTFSK